MENVNCIFCNEEHQLFWRENNYTGRRCLKCGLIYLSPRPDEKEMQLLYETGRSGGESTKEHIAYNFAKDLVARHCLSIIKKFKRKGDLLEIGAGGGYFLLNAKKQGFNTFAVEINQELAIYISKELGIKTENISVSCPSYFGSQKFDIIYHKDVLSHLHDPIKAFRILNNKLKEDGIMIFETGNFGDLSRFWLNIIGRLGYPEHLFLFSIKSAKLLLKTSGFKLKRYYCHSIILYQLISKILKSGKQIPKHTEINKKITLFQKLKDYITYFLVYEIGRVFPKSWPATVTYIATKEDAFKEVIY